MKVLLLTPSKGSVCLEQRDMLMRLVLLLKERGHRFATGDDTTSGLLHHSRNVLLGTLALRPDVDVGLWLDADVYFRPEILLPMIEREEEVIAWNYPMSARVDPFHPPEKYVAWAEKLRARGGSPWTGHPMRAPAGGLVWSEDGALCEMLQVAFGCLLMKRSCAEVMRRAMPLEGLDWGGRALVPAFNMIGSRVGEDYSFCKRWRGIGGRIWCEPTTYVNNGNSGGRYSDEIAATEKKTREMAPVWGACSLVR